MGKFYDTLETRSQDERENNQLETLKGQLQLAASAPDACRITEADVTALSDLEKLPVLRKSDLSKWQKEKAPFGGLYTNNVSHVFQSPGPIYEPGSKSADAWRMGRFLHAAGIAANDTVQNCFSSRDRSDRTSGPGCG